jgi:hypothetical protein
MENNKIEDYIIITNERKDFMAVLVLDKIKNGYVPLGGVSVTLDSIDAVGYRTYFAQAMVKYSDK